jgi:hypothetical protein
MRVGGAIGVALLWMAGCGGETTTQIALLGPDAGASAVCSELAETRCTKRDSCTNGNENARDYGNLATCIARMTLSCTQGLTDAGAEGTVATNEACVSQLTSLSCADFLAGNYGAPCHTSGAGANGTPCHGSSDCATYYCANDRYAVCGTCADAPASGASCRESNCASANQTCVWSYLLTNVCEPMVGIGGSCSEGSAPGCAPDLACMRAPGATTGTCAAAVGTAGAACNSGNPTNVGCDGTRGLSCDDNACAAIQYVGDGMPCGTLPGGAFAECSAGTCYTAEGPFTSSVTPTGTCKAFAADGAACNAVSGPGCMSPARCVTRDGASEGTCTLLTPAVTAACP